MRTMSCPASDITGLGKFERTVSRAPLEGGPVHRVPRAEVDDVLLPPLGALVQELNSKDGLSETHGQEVPQLVRASQVSSIGAAQIGYTMKSAHTARSERRSGLRCSLMMHIQPARVRELSINRQTLAAAG